MSTRPDRTTTRFPDHTPRGVVFGGGSVGRGFIGEVLLDAGWSVTFVDASHELVTALATGSYPHDTVSSSGRQRKILTGFTTVPAQDVLAVARAVSDADVVFTSVGARNLPQVAPLIAAGLVDRHAAGCGPVDVFLAENIHDGSGVMRELLVGELQRRGVNSAEAVMKRVGIVETSIGRMIPVSTAAQRLEHPALVAVEPYRQLPFDLSACRAPVPDVPELLGRVDVDFSFYSDRKLYVHNFGHCFTAYLGSLAGKEEIAATIDDPRIVRVVRHAMYVTARSLAFKYGQPVNDLLDHADDLLERFANTSLHDTVQRVGRDPERKLQPGDRFFGALSLAVEWGDPSAVIPGVALAVHQLVRSRPDAQAALTVAPMRREVVKAVPGLAGRFDELLDSLLNGVDLNGFIRLLDRRI